MSQPELKAEKINSPIQLMAAWFVMLILLTGVLLGAAIKIEHPSWAAGFLVISSTLFILLVIVAVFLMLTKFRPHLQEGKEYSEWLKDKNIYTHVASKKSTTNIEKGSIYKKIERFKSASTSPSDSELINRLEDSILYSVNVSNIEGANRIIEGMNELDINATIYKSSDDIVNTKDDNEAIWLGRNVPASIAIPVIKKAVKIWPHLKYIAFPMDSAPEEVMWEIYIGGATSTAKERRYRPWSIDEINKLQPMDTAEFHVKVRGKYP